MISDGTNDKARRDRTCEIAEPARSQTESAPAPVSSRAPVFGMNRRQRTRRTRRVAPLTHAQRLLALEIENALLQQLVAQNMRDVETIRRALTAPSAE
jgi:hypothetical protein